MKRYPGMKVMLAGLALLAAACGGERSVASKSAAAYDEAKAKGIDVGGGHEHGGHDAGAATEADHSAHGTAAGGAHAGHDMAAMDHSTMDHSTHGAAAGAHAGHDMAAMGHGTTAHAHAGHQMQSGTAAMDHSQHGVAATAPPRPPAAVGSIAPPSTTLQPDAFDAPAPVSVSEAAKASQGGGHEGHGTRGITPGEDRENPPTPMPAIRDGSNATTTAPAHDHHGGHGR